MLGEIWDKFGGGGSHVSYDSLNRLTSSWTTSTYSTSPAHCWGEVYFYDNLTTAGGGWGNLTQIAATTNSAYTGCSQESGFSKTVDGNNHLSGFGYDASGNTTGDGTYTYAWDGESQLKSSTLNSTTTDYIYDGDGRRVAKANPGTPLVPYKLYWYGSGGEILGETDGAGNTNNSSFNEYVFFGGQRIAMITNNGNPAYYVEDLLGTSRVLTSNTGVVCYDADFYPFGVERPPYTNTCSQNNYKFEGKERDTETLNDDFGARYYSNRFGRWLSADWSAIPAPVPHGNLTNPQTLNLYSMVVDDPESFADLDGHGPSNPNWDGEIVGQSVDFTFMSAMTTSLTPAEMDAQAKAQQQSQTTPQANASANVATQVAVDPGHGDQNNRNTQVDPGAVGGGLQEKDLTLAIANAVTSNLQASGVGTIQTRTGDVQNAGVKLQWRLDKAKGADIYVSIHINSSTSSQPNGFKVYYNASGKRLAEAIAKANSQFKALGVATSPYYINKFKGPGVLVEAGFISNASDRRILQNQSAQIGRDIASGILNYLKP